MAAAALRHLVLDIAKGRFQYKELITQAWFVVGVSVVPTLLVGVLLCGVVAFAGVLTGFLFNLLAQGGTRAATCRRSRPIPTS